jgi:hypothetical protein
MMIQYFSNLDADGLLALLCPIMIWSVLMSFLLSLMIALEDAVKRLRRIHQIPCNRCQYYTGSHYLKCPIHPILAFSEDAIDCQDFEPATYNQPRVCHCKPIVKDWSLNRH